MSAPWRQCVSFVRRFLTGTERVDYQIDYNGEIMECGGAVPACASDGRVAVLHVEGGIVTSTINGCTTTTSYTLTLHRNAVLLAPSTRTHDAPVPSDTAVVFGPSAALTLAEEWLGAGGDPGGPRLRIAESLASPYPPHTLPGARDEEVAIGTLDEHARIEVLLLQPASWSRPLAALDADRFASLRVGCRATAPMPATALVVDSMIPLTANPAAMEWEAAMSVVDAGGVRPFAKPIRFVAPVAVLVDSVMVAVGAKTTGVVRDPVAGDHFGLAAPLLSSLRAGDFPETA